MGLFSTRTRVYVDSVAYNIAGPLTDRPSYLKSTVARSVLMGGQRSLGGDIVSSQLFGPTMDQRAFFRWARSKYPAGTVTGNLSTHFNVNAAIVAAHIPVPAGYSLSVQAAMVDTADPGYYAEQYILNVRPEDYQTNWTYDFDASLGRLEIFFEGSTSVSLNVPEFDPAARYVVAYYTEVENQTQGPWNLGTPVTDDPVRPSTAGWTQTSYSSTTEFVGVTDTRITTVDDGVNPPDVTTEYFPNILPFDAVDETYEQTVPGGPVPGSVQIVDQRQRLTISSHYEIVETVTTSSSTDGSGVTTTIEDRVQSPSALYDHQMDWAELISYNMTNGQKVFIYKIGSGNAALDALRTPAGSLVEFYPVIPLRIGNRPVDHTNFSAHYPTLNRAFRRATGKGLSGILSDIEDNPNIGDVDHAYLVHGVELNTLEPEGQRYLFEFLRQLVAYQTATITDVEQWVVFRDSYEAQLNELALWEQDQSNPGSPRWRTPRPVIQVRTMPNVSNLITRTTDQAGQTDFMKYHTQLSWMAIGETISAGLGKPGAKKDDFWWEILPDIVQDGVPWNLSWQHALVSGQTIGHCKFYWQSQDNQFRVLEIYGLTHENFIYQGNSEKITAKQALQDSNESGFVVPLHYPTVRSLPLIIANQLAVSNKLVVFNCYQLVKQRWYERGIFRFIGAIVIAVISALVFPGGIGLLGSHLAVGTSMGFSGMLAVVAGAAMNALAAIVLSITIEVGATALAGEKWGRVLSVLASYFVMSAVISYHMTGSFALNWGDMLRADNLLRVSDVLMKTMTGYAQGEIAQINQEIEDLTGNYEKRSKAIEKKTLELLGYGGGMIDPLMFIQTEGNYGFNPETPSTFLSRTLLTGSEIADLSLSMIELFPEVSLTLPTAFD